MNCLSRNVALICQVCNFAGLTFSPGRQQGRSISDGPSPPLSLLVVGDGVLDQRHTKALLHSLTGHSGAHPSPLEWVEISCKVGSDVRAVRPSVRTTADTVCQVKNYLSPTGWWGDPLDGQRALRQTDCVSDPVVLRVAELPVQHAQHPVPQAGWVWFRGVSLHPRKRATRPAGRCADGGALQILCTCNCLLWDLLNIRTAAFVVQSLSLVTERGKDSDGAGGVSVLSPTSPQKHLLLQNTILTSRWAFGGS